MTVKITTLIENSAGEHLGLKTEHGISFFIEKNGHKILFDTGQTGSFIENAKQLKIDLTALEYVVLSHGHYDHSGGVRSLTQITTNFKMIVGQGFFDEKYAYRKNSYEYLGNSFDETFLESLNITYQYAREPLTEISSGIYVVTNFPRQHNDEIINPRFKVMRNGSIEDDPFTDEVLVAIDTTEGLIVLLGCSHPGMKNMLDAATDLIQRPIYAVLGGTHLVESDEKSLEQSLAYLNHDSLKMIGVSHCTGNIAMTQLAVKNSHYFHNRTGSSLIVA